MAPPPALEVLAADDAQHLGGRNRSNGVSPVDIALLALGAWLVLSVLALIVLVPWSIHDRNTELGAGEIHACSDQVSRGTGTNSESLLATPRSQAEISRSDSIAG